METWTKACGPIPGGLILTHTQIYQKDPLLCSLLLLLLFVQELEVLRVEVGVPAPVEPVGGARHARGVLREKKTINAVPHGPKGGGGTLQLGGVILSFP